MQTSKTLAGWAWRFLFSILTAAAFIPYLEPLSIAAQNVPGASGSIVLTNAVQGPLAGIVTESVTTNADGSTNLVFYAAPQVGWAFAYWQGLPDAAASNNPASVPAGPGLAPVAVLTPAPGFGLPGQPSGASPGLTNWAFVAKSFNLPFTNYPGGMVSEWVAFGEDTYTDAGIATTILNLDGTVIVQVEGNLIYPVTPPVFTFTLVPAPNWVVELGVVGNGCNFGGTPAENYTSGAVGGPTSLQTYSVYPATEPYPLAALLCDGTLACDFLPETNLPGYGITGTGFLPGTNFPGEHLIALACFGPVRTLANMVYPPPLFGLADDGTIITVVAPYGGSPGVGNLTLSDGLAEIAFDPGPTNIFEGQEIRLCPRFAPATGYQWYKDGVAMAGRTNNYLKFTAGMSDSGVYQVEAFNSQTALAGQPIPISVYAQGTPQVTLNGTLLPLGLSNSGPQGNQATVALSTSFAGGEILYTLDGSVPGFTSTLYTQPIVVTQTVIIRALALSQDFSRQTTNTPLTIPVLPAYTLETAVSGQGQITVSPLATNYLTGQLVTLKATPAAEWEFSGWAGDASGTSPQISLVMTNNLSVTGIFTQIPQYPVSVGGGGGAVTVAPSGSTFYEGTQIEVKETANAGWTFEGWLGSYLGSETNFAWEVEGAASFTAVFGTSISNVPSAGGDVQLYPDLPLYPYGSQVAVNAVPVAGNCLVLWGGAAAGQTATEWVLTVTNAHPVVSALFQALPVNQASLTVKSAGGGVVLQNPAAFSYGVGTTVTLTAQAFDGWVFSHWSGGASGSNPQISVTVAAAMVPFEAVFVPGGTPILALNPVWSGSSFSVTVQTQIGIMYSLESKASLTDANWTVAQSLEGTGAAVTLTDSSHAAGSSGFYRVAAQ